MDGGYYLVDGLGSVELRWKTTLLALAVTGSGLLLCKHDEVSHSYHTICDHNRHSCVIRCYFFNRREIRSEMDPYEIRLYFEKFLRSLRRLDPLEHLKDWVRRHRVAKSSLVLCPLSLSRRSLASCPERTSWISLLMPLPFRSDMAARASTPNSSSFLRNYWRDTRFNAGPF